MSETPKRLLSALMVMGAQSPERAMSVDELSSRLGVPAEAVELEVQSLLDAGYAQIVEDQGGRRVYLSGTGIITASSAYS